MSDDFEYQLQQEFNERKSSQEEGVGEVGAAHQKDTHYKTDPNDGTEYQWNEKLKIWVPNIDQDFIARYQSNYGCFQDTNSTNCDNINDPTTYESHQTDQSDQTDQTDHTHLTQTMANNSSNSSDSNDNKDNKKTFVSKLLKRSVDCKPLEWFEVSDEYNTKVYVNNLPLDTTEEEFLELMKKCGLIEKDDRNEYKIKLYRDSNGQLKGDGLCTYMKIESVDLALNILDGYSFKSNIISVERAKFALKGQFNPELKPKRKKRDKQKEKKKMEKLFDWRPENIKTTERHKSEKTVVIKNMFEPKEFLLEPKLILEYRSDLREECTQKCGSVKRIDIYDCHPEGVATITFTEFQSADQCLQLMNGRFFAGRRLSAHHWDGKTKYKIEETEDEAQKRLQHWEDFLENDNN